MNQTYGRLVSRAAIAATVMASLLLLIKIFAWWYTGSVSILAALVDSLVDIAASLTNLLVVRYSLQPADDEHTFWTRQAESLAALAQSMFISGSALFSVFDRYSASDYPYANERTGRRDRGDAYRPGLYDHSGHVSALGCAQDAKSGSTGRYASLSV